MKVHDTAPLTGKVNANITGAAVEIHLLKPTGVTLVKTPTITDALTGAWKVTFGANDVDVAGLWYVEAQVTFSGGEIQTFGPTRWRVHDEIA